MEAKGIAVGNGALVTMLLKGDIRTSDTAKAREDEQESGIRRMRRDESAQQDKVLYPL
ncbi:hypothetical protein UWK_02845 [Desulfocapsa sulfexigens DSM 10523]|uniref:Uncharacterized protein n=2 Tax=Desulfocapsa TaxID=53318 RepID=M1PSS7_DESSD|nr:hypothetical protein UWK_02845 [Desulfocapsa sulfexigens DSM 10523]